MYKFKNKMENLIDNLLNSTEKSFGTFFHHKMKETLKENFTKTIKSFFFKPMTSFPDRIIRHDGTLSDNSMVVDLHTDNPNDFYQRGFYDFKEDEWIILTGNSNLNFTSWSYTDPHLQFK